MCVCVCVYKHIYCCVASQYSKKMIRKKPGLGYLAFETRIKTYVYVKNSRYFSYISLYINRNVCWNILIYVNIIQCVYLQYSILVLEY
jgi:hypothetical protein